MLTPDNGGGRGRRADAVQAGEEPLDRLYAGHAEPAGAEALEDDALARPPADADGPPSFKNGSVQRLRPTAEQRVARCLPGAQPRFAVKARRSLGSVSRHEPPPSLAK